MFNRNKKSIAIDLHNPGAAVARKLAASADVVAEKLQTRNDGEIRARLRHAQ